MREGHRTLLGRDDGADGLDRFELYDLRRDERQTHDVAPAEPGTVNRLSERLSDLHREVRAEGRTKNGSGDRAPVPAVDP